MKNIIILFACIFTLQNSFGQDLEKLKTDITKRVFDIDNNSEKYEKLSQAYGANLLTVNDFEYVSFQKSWIGFLQKIENYATKKGIKLDGTQVRFKVFWNETGRIDYIGYNLYKLPSNYTFVEFENFLNSFIETEDIGKPYTEKYSCYSMAEFPVPEFK